MQVQDLDFFAGNFDDHGHHHHIPHNTEKIVYRLVYGTSWEGISVRQIYYDKDGNMLDWSRFPLLTLAASVPEVQAEVVKIMNTADEMLEATKLPVIREDRLEAGYKI